MMCGYDKYIELTIVFDEETPSTASAESEEAEETPAQRQQMSGDDLFREFFGGSPFGR